MRGGVSDRPIASSIMLYLGHRVLFRIFNCFSDPHWSYYRSAFYWVVVACSGEIGCGGGSGVRNRCVMPNRHVAATRTLCHKENTGFFKPCKSGFLASGPRGKCRLFSNPANYGVLTCMTCNKKIQAFPTPVSYGGLTAGRGENPGFFKLCKLWGFDL